ncbi:IS1 family transposase [Klebsiella pneumoniae]
MTSVTVHCPRCQSG